MSLQADDFPQFFREVNDGKTPFPWQTRLARQVCDARQWPEYLDLPTGTGKTAVLEIAIFHLALEAKRLAERRAPVRIAFVVDRRLIVDQTYRRASKIQELLVPGESAAGRVATELSFLSDGKPCLLIQRLRGGLPRESDWARTPVQPTVLLSTVDQVGSRLLFRGYGISPSMRPIHAGLLGSDCLIFLDEAHLSEPFRQSLGWIGLYRDKPWSKLTSAPWAAISMSATLGTSVTQAFSLDSDDSENEILKKRLEASKLADLCEIPNTKVAAAYAEMARKFAQEKDVYKILIVVNRVDLARAIFEELAAENPILLTGRVREPDRARIVDDLLARLPLAEERLFVVATQCIEAGADLDFDALVTQIAPLDALKQRFGRLNRTGRDIQAKAAIFATRDELSPKKPDPVYGDHASEAWVLLKKIARSEDKRQIVDFGSAALKEKLVSHDLNRACCERSDAPVMLPAYVDLWTRTNPEPLIEPDVALFLHGPDRGAPDVEIVWRADISREALNDRDRMVELLALVPPRSAETLSVPVWKVRDWLAYDSAGATRLSDTEGEPDLEERRGGDRRVLRWYGAEDDRTRVVTANKIRPGDTIVVPSSYGGCDNWGWTGRDQPGVSDVANFTIAELRPAEIPVRFHPSLFPAEQWSTIRPLLEQYSDDAKQLRAELLELGAGEELLNAFSERWPAKVDFLYKDDEPGEGLVLVGRRSKEKRAPEPSTESDQAGNSADEPISLSEHTLAVTHQTNSFANRAGLCENVRQSLKFAAELHDSGKGDRRFQELLRNGAPGTEILAKSHPQRARMMRTDCGLPPHWRHEALSVRIAIDDGRFSADATLMDRELALWLIGTHHGHGRPFFPHDDDSDDFSRSILGSNGEILLLPAASGPQRLDFDWNGLDWASLQDLLHRRYGPWELARLEAILRLADHRASEG